MLIQERLKKDPTNISNWTVLWWNYFTANGKVIFSKKRVQQAVHTYSPKNMYSHRLNTAK